MVVYKILNLKNVASFEILITTGWFQGLPKGGGYKVKIVWLYKVLNSISKKGSPRFGYRTADL